MPPGVSTNYRYHGNTKNGKGQRVIFAWTCHRNAAGYFLGWRETYRKNGTIVRDKWTARKSRKAVLAIAKKRTAQALGKAAE